MIKTENKTIIFAKVQGVFVLEEERSEDFLGLIRLYNAKDYKNCKSAFAIIKGHKKVEMMVKYDTANEVLELSTKRRISLNYLQKVVWEI